MKHIVFWTFLVVSGLAAVQQLHALWIQRTWKGTTGTVIRYRERRAWDDEYFPVATYTVDGREYEATDSLGVIPWFCRPGDEVPIRHSAKNPAHGCIHRPVLRPVTLVVATVIFIGILIALIPDIETS